MPPKIRVALSVQDKLDILAKLKDGVKATRLASEYGVANSTITGIKKNEEVILDMAVNTHGSRKLKLAHQSVMLDVAMSEWLADKRTLSIPVSGPMAAARRMNTKFVLEKGLGKQDFTVSTNSLR